MQLFDCMLLFTCFAMLNFEHISKNRVTFFYTLPSHKATCEDIPDNRRTFKVSKRVELVELG